MAQSITDEEIQLKKRARRRLVGAVALVLIVVIFLPMVLDNEPKPVSQDIAISIPSRENSDFNSKIVPAQEKTVTNQVQPPLAKPAKSAQMSVPEDEPVVVAAPVKMPAPSKPIEPVTPKPVNKPIVESKTTAKAVSQLDANPKTDAKPKSEAKSKVEAKPVITESLHKADAVKSAQQGYVVQLGAFSNMDNAKQRQTKLAALGIRFYTGTIKSTAGDKLRVRAGPYATRQEAEKVQAKLKAAGISDGIVAEKKD